LTVDTSVITATGNDYGYEHIFERQVLGLGQPGDVFLGISTSGKSPTSSERSMRRGGRAWCRSDSAARSGADERSVPASAGSTSGKTAIIQQIHIVAAHIVCALVERAMFPRSAA